MKYNLKNRPNFTTDAKTVEELHSDAWHFVHMEVDKWFEGFEAELRKELDKETEFFSRSKTAAKGLSRIKIEWIKQILGEDSSGVEQR